MVMKKVKRLIYWMEHGVSQLTENHRITSDVIINNCQQWQLQCVGINKLYNKFRVMIEKKIYRTAHIIPAFYAHFLGRECLAAPNVGNARNIAQSKLRSAS